MAADDGSAQQPSINEVFELALELHRKGRLSEAEQFYRRILTRQPEHSDSLHLLGVVALQTGNLEAAHELIQHALDLRPDAAIYRNSLGQVLESSGRPDEAAAAYEAALELDPAYAEAANNLGHVLLKRDRLSDAEEQLRTAIQLNPYYAEPHTNLGNVLKERGRLDDAIASYRRAVEIRPDVSFLHSNLLLTLHYHDDYTVEDLAREHREWAQRHVAPLASRRRPHQNDAAPDRRLRVGYVSPDFRQHPAARFIMPLFAAHDRDRVEVFAYSGVTRPDDVTERIRASADVWRDVAALNDDRLAALVRDDGIDILVDLSAHSAGNRLLVFARKPAPVQVTYLAYCGGTTGVDAVDYRLTDRFIDPPGEDAGRHYVERSFHLPECYWCYSAPTLPSGDVPSTERRPGPLTFGCLNNFAKVTERTLATWARLLARVPDARLLLYAHAGSHRGRVHDVLRRNGLSETRLTFVGKQGFEDYLETYRRIDVALDPFPFAGGTTTCDALWMGVPVVSLAGRTPVSRAGASLLAGVGLEHLVADSAERYVEIAAGLIADRDELAALRGELRGRIASSRLMDAQRFAGELEDAYRSMWRVWCQAQV